MSREYRIPLEQIPRGEGRTFELAGRKVAVFRNRQDQVFASQASCPHRAGPLADGLLGGSTLICPLHDWTFELSTGESLNGSCGIKTYAARLDGAGAILVAVDDGAQMRACEDGPATDLLASGAPSP